MSETGSGAGAAVSVAATFCATLVEEWVSSGLTDAVIAPGSRSTPMALALASHPAVAVHVVHDERVAGFVTLGIGLAGTPAVVLCTSGTAAANLAPAVVEAGLSNVPMLVLTADRPPELRDVGAPQTIDQTHLFGRSVRWFHDPGVPDEAAQGSWRSLARRSFMAALVGPVHLNLPFREPLVGEPGALPPARSRAAELPRLPGTVAVSSRPCARPPDGLDRPRGLIVVGGRSGVTPAEVERLADRTRWPVLADPTSGMRHLDGVVTAFDSMLRHRPFAEAHAPDVVVRIGRPPASRVLAEWVRSSGAVEVQVGGPGVIDPSHTVSASCEMDDVVAAVGAGASATPWLARWRHAERRAQEAIDAVVTGDERLTEPALARAVADLSVELGIDEVVVASSMPVRDLEWFGGARARAHANRGANGIDGTVSTALGIALGGASVMALVGDIAFVHDSNALVALGSRGHVDLRIVVADNDGGGIFSFLPQAGRLGHDRFEQLFGTPHGTDLEALARAHRVPARTVTTLAELRTAVSVPGPLVARVPSDRATNVEVHARLHAAVAAALDA